MKGCMPGLIGGFGNLKYNNFYKCLKKYFTTQKIILKDTFNSEKILSSYLAGLIEGDGTIVTPSKKGYAPQIIIVFNLKDLPLAEHLQFIIKCGKIQKPKGRGYILWAIQDIEGIIKIINLINGYMRTPKIEALHRLIN
jgi:DNA-binding transcriptional regulator WhiA